MPKNGPFDDRCRWPPQRRSRFLISIAVPITALLLAGCGGGEDFSKPPAQIQNQLAKTTDDSGAPSADGTEAAIPEEATASEPNNTTTDAVAEPAATPPADAAAANSEIPAVTAAPAGTVAPATTPAPEATKPAEAASGDGAEVLTASGKSAEAIAAKKDANSSKSVMGNAGGLLGSLKTDAAKKADAAAAATPGSNPDAAQITTRFGRMAMSRLQWLELVSQLTRQFFVASTPDGNSLAGSTGERSVEIIDTQLDLRRQTQTPGNRTALTSADPIHVPVRGLPGIINSLELTHDGQQVLVGTTDGRLLVRSAASTANWDLFARDLFLFQDEHRHTARLSDKALVAIRCLPNDQILTIDANGVCAFWKSDSAVLAATPIMEMTAEQAKAAEAETVVVTPISSFPVSGFEILSITIDDKLQLGAIVSSSEEVYVFRTTTGELIETLKADLFADTQPVCVDFIADGTEIIAGLADGRILRRALTGATAVSGLNDQGETVDYELVFIPDVQDPVSSITSIRSIPNSHTIYFGTVDGTVVRFDTAQKRIQQLTKRHAGPVIEFCLTPHGVLSIGGDRQAQLFDPPQTPLSNNQNAEVAFQLPMDETLGETIVDDSVTQNGAATPASRPTRPAKARVAEEAASADLSLAGIRPADSALALYAHQLRSAKEPAQQLALRKQILRHRGENSLADSLGTEPAEVPDGPPLRAGDTTTPLQFHAGNWSRVRLSISDDGTTVAVLHRAAGDQADQHTLAKALSLFDLPTGTALRYWTQPVPGQSLNLNSAHHVLLPTPASTRFWLTTGYLEKDLLPVSATAVSADTNTLVRGLIGTTGMVAPLLTLMNLNDRTETRGMELFEGMITAAAFTNAGDRLMVGTRVRDQVRLLELEPGTLSIQQEIMREPLEGRIPDISEDPSQQAKSGTMLIQFSPSDKLMLTMGNYAGGSQMRLWRRSKSGWPREDVTVITATEANPDFDAIDQPITFVNGQDSRLAIVTANGLLILNTRKGIVEKMIPIPSVSGHRPPCVFSPDGKWALMGDGEGTVWAASLVSLDSKPLKFEAHNAPIAGLAISRNGRYLATIGEQNHLRAWRVDGFLKR